MLKYLIIPLAANAVSFCRYERNMSSSKVIDIYNLKKIITWAMKENVNIQFLFPDEILPSEYADVINSVDHISIVAATCSDNTIVTTADIIVFDNWNSITDFQFSPEKRYIIRTSKEDFFDHVQTLKLALSKANSVVVIIKDIDRFNETDFHRYKGILESLIPFVADEIKKGRNLHFNLLTDRLSLTKMNNCGAGDETLTYNVDGKFYICPAYCNVEEDSSVGDLETGLDIKNPQLYKLGYAPICRMCDAYQCHRCIWLNNKTTLEVNIPSHEQCVVSHIERNASKMLLNELKGSPGFDNLSDIKEISYLDPFDLIEIPCAHH